MWLGTYRSQTSLRSLLLTIHIDRMHSGPGQQSRSNIEAYPPCRGELPSLNFLGRLCNIALQVLPPWGYVLSLEFFVIKMGLLHLFGMSRTKYCLIHSLRLGFRQLLSLKTKMKIIFQQSLKLNLLNM